jgi:hypothetical protein
VQVTESGSGEREFAGHVGRWLIASAIALVALIGVFLLVAAIVVALEPPLWMGGVIGAVLAIGAAAFAWLVASALASGKKHSEQDGVSRIRPRE